MLSGTISTVERWFGLEERWERPTPGRDEVRRDIAWALAATVVAVLGHELMRSGGALQHERLGAGWQYAVILSLTALVAVRRRHPILVMVVAGAHIFVASYFTPMTMSQLTLQMVYFLLIFSGVAWARDRRALLGGVVFVLVMLLLWFAWSFALTSGLESLRAMMGEDLDGDYGLVSPMVGIIGYTILANLIFFLFAFGLGVVAWHGALRRAQVVEQAETIRTQAARLRNQAVVAERLRIARELHDVVAHHVSVMGVQATAARRVLDRDPEAARTALGAIEQSSRDAVGQMRDLLGTLRSEDLDDGAGGMPNRPGGDGAAGPGAGRGRAGNTGPAGATGPGGPAGAAGAAGSAHRAPQPTLAALPALVEQASTPTSTVALDVVESASGAAGRVPPPVQLSAYRVVQEALANVRKHSTARHARVTVRVDEGTGRIEVEVVDDGLARTGTSGTGLGLLGMRERAQHLGGGVEAGPRAGSPGYRVRVWFPLDGRGAAAHRSTPPAESPVADASVGA